MITAGCSQVYEAGKTAGLGKEGFVESGFTSTAIDETIYRLMADEGVPGCAFALSRKGRLIFSKGYGWADIESGVEVDARSLFRIASLSKPITSVAVLKLMEAGQFTLDDPAFGPQGILPSISPVLDPRAASISIRHLLEHSGGWDRGESFDPLWQQSRIARETGSRRPLNSQAIIEYMLTRHNLDYEPGSRQSYSNLGYCILGRIIEQCSGTSYEKFVQDRVMQPLGIETMRIGGDGLADRYPEEVVYYRHRGGSKYDTKGTYEWGISAHDANGGWIASAPDLVRFINSLDPHFHGNSPLSLSPASIALMLQAPDSSNDQVIAYAKGWEVEGPYFWHIGKMPGSYGILAHFPDGISYAFLCNSRLNVDDFFKDLAYPLRNAITESINTIGTADAEGAISRK